MIFFKELEKITGGNIKLLDDADGVISHLITDSRKSFFVNGSLFFAIKGERHDGHQYIPYLYEKGVRQFIIDKNIDLSRLEGSNVLQVENSLNALQRVAEFHRSQLHPEVVGITGSNGKTIVKEWLFQLLAPYKRAIRSPHSYNSQIGVPLSVWQLNDQHELGIFEAGLSQPGEMERLQPLIGPDTGIFTNVGSAHDSGFSSRDEKIMEKCRLFTNTSKVIYCKDHQEIDRYLHHKGFTWGWHPDSDVRIEDIYTLQQQTKVTVDSPGKHTFTLPFADKASVENCMHCIAYMFLKGFSEQQIQEGVSKLHYVRMRMEQKRGINQCYLIDDVYNNDIGGLQIALDLLANHHQHERRSVIISDILQSGLSEEVLYLRVSQLFKAAGVSKTIGIGPALARHSNLFTDYEAYFFDSTEEFLQKYTADNFRDEIILIKGARVFAFEKIVRALEEKIHGTHLEINMDALTSNLNFYRSKLQANARLMVMVKAFAYGSGSLEVANLLQFHHVDYLGVAYADEGMVLRKNGIYLPIMVMNPSKDSFEKLYQYDLETTIYNISILKDLIRFSQGRVVSIHLELETGMQRLGFDESVIDELILLLREHPYVKVKSIFSHLAGADEPEHERFSRVQAQKFERLSQKITDALSITPLRHLVNSPGILRYPEYHFDMVRLGIGLYGFEASHNEQDKLRPVSRLKTIISQVKHIKKGETVGYSRKGRAEDSDKTIATVAIGYADGFSRAFSNGIGEVWIKGSRAPVIGNVCMDMTMVDITGIDAREGDEVEIFGEHITIAELADKIDTIPYEILTNVSQRVKRVYYTE